MVVFDGRAASWMNELRDPQHWEPGCIGMDEAGNTSATGGDPQNGATRWMPNDSSIWTYTAVEAEKRSKRVGRFRGRETGQSTLWARIAGRCRRKEDNVVKYSASRSYARPDRRWNVDRSTWTCSCSGAGRPHPRDRTNPRVA